MLKIAKMGMINVSKADEGQNGPKNVEFEFLKGVKLKNGDFNQRKFVKETIKITQMASNYLLKMIRRFLSSAKENAWTLFGHFLLIIFWFSA